MIFVNFDLKELRAQLEASAYEASQALSQNNSFNIEVDGVNYFVEYEVVGKRIEFFAQSPEAIPSLAQPSTRFSLGDFLLPEAMAGRGQIVHPSDFVRSPEVYVHDTDPDIPIETREKILSAIKNIGILNLLQKN